MLANVSTVRIDMTFNAPNLAAQIGLAVLAWTLARRGFQLIEILIKAVLLVYRQNNQDLPPWFANQYKKINGNATASREEKNDLLGPKNDSSAKHKAAVVGKVE